MQQSIPLRVQPIENSYSLAVKDIMEGFKAWRIWIFLAWQDTRLRYHRSYLGPFWITINMAVTIYAIGFLYGRLFKMDLSQYYPALAAGLLSWNLISTLITELVDGFASSHDYIKQIKLPYSAYVFRIIARNLMIFCHNILIFIPILFLFKVPVSVATLSIFPSLLLIVSIAYVYGLLLGMIGARFRDVAAIITSFVQVIFFLTPIIWQVSTLPEHSRYLVKLNPFAQLIELIRNPMLGQFPSLFAVGTALTLIAVGSLVTFFIFAKKRKQIIYWL